MIVFPMWMLKYIMVLGGLGVFIQDGAFYGLVLAALGAVWCANNWSKHEK